MRRRVLLVQPSMQPPGGGNGVAAWMLQALVEAGHDVTVLSWWPVDVAPINRFFGTSLHHSQFSTREVPQPFRWVADPWPVPAALFRTSLMMRYTKRMTDGFDVIIGANNESDYGRRGIQYVHYPSYLRPRPEVDIRWYHLRPLLLAYYAFSDALADVSVERMRGNVTLANSQWTAAGLERSLGVRAQVVYPPVVEPALALPWADRTPGFVAMGRFSPEKEYERIIRILAKVRQHALDVTLTIVGTIDRGARSYFRRVRDVVRSLDASRWVTLRHHLSRDEVRALLASHRYGIHGMREEHFGMAPAEMVRSGMIVWVPDGGGQVEIVGDAPLLRYGSEEQAIKQILRVLGDPAEESRLREHLAVQAARFSERRFVEEIQAVVDAFR
jgi:glycosyltransferase involved in cell wall biosynthesis